MKIFLSKSRNKPLAAFSFIRRIGRDPFMDWPLIVVAWFLLSVVLAGSSVVKYLNINQEISTPAQITTSTIPTFDRELLNKVIHEFDSRASERADLIKIYNGPTDPSL